MRPLPPLLLALAVALLTAAAGAAPADARSRTSTFGIAEQKADVFADARFAALGMRHARRSIGWDWNRYDWQIADIDQWMNAARAARVTPVVTFARSRVGTRRKLVPTAGQMAQSLRAFRARYPWSREFVASNESNSFGEPTGRRPKLAVQYWRAMQKVCRTCRIAAATLLDQPNMIGWTRAFVRAARTQPKLWALHNYLGVNRRSTTSTRRLLRTVKGRVWITETGGIVVRRRDFAGKNKMPEGRRHAARVTRWLVRSLTRVSPRVQRIYLYHWNADGPGDSWDSAFIGADGRARSSYGILARGLRALRTGR